MKISIHLFAIWLLATASALAQSPDIRIFRSGTEFTEGTSAVYGAVAPGSTPFTEVFTIQNSGTALLTNFTFNFDGVGAEEVSLLSPPAASVAAGGSTTFTIRIGPISFGQKSVGIHIGSNVTGVKNPFDIGAKYLVAYSFHTSGTTSGKLPWNRPDQSGPNPPFQLSLTANAVPYDAISFTVGASGTYVLTSGFTAFSPTSDTHLVLYSGFFNASFPLINAMASVGEPTIIAYAVGSERDNPDFNSTGVVQNLQAGVTYFLVTTGVANSNSGTYSIGIHGPGSAAVVGTAPEITVQQPAGTGINDGGPAVTFGSAQIGASTARTFTIINSGSANLVSLGVTKDGAQASDFTVSTLGVSSLTPGQSATFTVTFAPTAVGTRNAAVHISSNDADENPFDISMTGQGDAAAPEIVVEQPAGVGLTDDNSTIVFPVASVGGTSVKTITIRNTGLASLTELAASLDGPNSGEFVAGALGTTTLAPGGATTFNVTFTAAGLGTRSAALRIASNDADENPFDILLAGAVTTSNEIAGGAITIPSSGNGTPYPSTISVSGVAGMVMGLKAKINGFTHTYPSDVDAFLLSPTGKVCALMSDAGGSTSVSNINLVLDDGAAANLPSSALSSGTYRPTDYSVGEALPPGGTGTIGTVLADLASGGANGDWKLFVSDDTGGDSGSIASWSLVFDVAPGLQESWRLSHFGTTANIGNAADAFDYDGDGLTNLVEFAFGLNPKAGGSVQLPVGYLAGANYVISFARPVGVSGITYGAEWSTNLQSLSWTPIPDTGTPPQHVFSVPISSNTRIFTRLKVTSP